PKPRISTAGPRGRLAPPRTASRPTATHACDARARPPSPSAEGVDDPPVLLAQALREAIAEAFEIGAEILHLRAPLRRVDREQLRERLGRDIETRDIEILRPRQIPDRLLDGPRAPLASVDDPAQHPQVLAEAGPEEAAVRVAPKPVHVEDLRQRARPLGEAEPVRPVVAVVVAAERLHRHRI